MLDIVREVIRKNHARLDGASIAVIVQEKASSKGGKTVYSTAAKPSEKLKPLLEDDYSFVITVAEDTWKKMNMDQRKAVIDHELCHCQIDLDGKPSIREHDLEEFAEIIERHGFWREDYGEHMVQEALIKRGVKVGTLKKKVTKGKV